MSIIEQDDGRIEEIADAWIVTVIQGDASDPGILEQAGIEGADTIAALTELMGLNLAVCLLATRLTDELRTLSSVTGAIEILEIRVAEGVPSAGRTLSETAFPAGTLVISGESGSRISNPETTLTPGSQYVVAVESGVVDEVLQLMRE